MIVAAVFVATALATPARAESQDRDAPTMVLFEGREVDVRTVWKEAAACVVWPDGATECYRTVEQREDAEAERLAGGEAGLLSSCPVRLYTNIVYGGSELTLHTRWTWHNLASWGFSNSTSSYKLSGCAATFRDGANGTGATYPGITVPWTWSPTMASGWNNRVSSVWIH